MPIEFNDLDVVSKVAGLSSGHLGASESFG